MPFPFSLTLSMRDCQARPMADSRALLILTLNSSSSPVSLGYSGCPHSWSTFSATSCISSHLRRSSPSLSLRNAAHFVRKSICAWSFALSESTSSSSFEGDGSSFECRGDFKKGCSSTSSSPRRLDFLPRPFLTGSLTSFDNCCGALPPGLPGSTTCLTALSTSAAFGS
jgi:hypothetical protein